MRHAVVLLPAQAVLQVLNLDSYSEGWFWENFVRRKDGVSLVRAKKIAA
jgi:hypothetical protein